jgi:hypothetical protein
VVIGKWVAKAVVQKGISFLPQPQRINHLFQKYVTGGTTLSPEFAAKRLEWAAMHVSSMERHGGPSSGYHAMELGSGWFPIVPLCLYMHGADEVSLCDIDDLGRPELTSQALDAVIGFARTGDLEKALGGIRTERLDELERARAEVMSLGHRATLERLGLSVRVGDVRDLHLSRAPDLICSNTVLEHIPPDVIVGILVAFRLNARPGTVMSHLVDLCDHYAYIDEFVDVYQFLTFPERRWRLIDNSIQPMNRLRVHQYRELYEQAGVGLVEEQRWEGDPADLDRLALAAPFDSMDRADVACKAVLLVSRF